MPRCAFSYLRCSAKKQLRGDTKRRQLEWSQAVCEQRGFRMDDTFKMYDWGKSAFRSKNVDVGNLGVFLRAAEAGRIPAGSVLLVESLDRLSRDYVDDAWDVFRRILKAGITIITRTPEREYTLEGVRNNFFALLEPLFIFVRAHEESQTKSMRVREAWDERKQAAAAGRVPHGHNGPAWCVLTGDGYQLDLESARTVRAIFLWAREGLGVWRITGRLQNEDYPTMGRSKRWSVAYVRKILRTRMAVGDYQPRRLDDKGKLVLDGEPIQGYYPAAVTETEWKAAQQAVASRFRKTGRPGRSEANLFTGIIHEAYTQAPLMLQPSAPRNGTRRAYLMTGKAGGTFVRYDEVEETILYAVRQLKPRDVVDRPEVLDERAGRISDLTKERINLNEKLAGLQAQIVDRSTKAQDVGFLVETAQALRDRRREVQRDLDALNLEATTGRPEALAEAQTLLELIEQTPPEGLEELRRRIKAGLRQVIEGVWVYAQRVRRGCQVVHIQAWLHNGRKVYLWVEPERLGVTRLDLDGQDFRVGTKLTPQRAPSRRRDSATRAQSE
jgi:DNA invertase Pin-like site-specific DNA recombinase